MKLQVIGAIFVISYFFSTPMMAQNNRPLKVGVVGLTHTHVHWILGRPDQGDIEIVGIVESNRDLATRYSDRHGFSMDIVYTTMEEMIHDKRPQAVTAFGSIHDHLKVVQVCAPKGIHVMVEKPLAVSLKHAREMQRLARQYHIELLTNYETTWYPSNHHAKKMVDDADIGALRKIVVHDGHRGPEEIGINIEFLEWLRDPKLNGAGALTDFGCYGANLITWLMKGRRPLSVTAIANTNKPEKYPEVDDEATIVLQYPKMQGIIQASWNWPISRKDMEIYGHTGQIFCATDDMLRYQLGEDQDQVSLKIDPLNPPHHDPFALFAAVIRGQVVLDDYDLSSIENNMIVMEILDAAMKSVIKKKTIKLK